MFYCAEHFLSCVISSYVMMDYALLISELLPFCKLGVLFAIKSSEFLSMREWIKHITCLISTSYYQEKIMLISKCPFSNSCCFLLLAIKMIWVALSLMISSHHGCCFMSSYVEPYSGWRPSSGYLNLYIFCCKPVSPFELIKFYVLWQVRFFFKEAGFE